MEQTENNKIIWVRGNTQSLIIPLEQEVMTEQEEIVAEPYYPDGNATVTVNFVSKFKKYSYTPQVDGNLLIFTDNAQLPAGCYGVEVLVNNPDGSQYRSMWKCQVIVTDANDSVLEEWDEFKEQDVKARAAIFFFAKGDKGDAFTYEDFTQEQIEGLKKPAYDAAAEVAALEQNIEAAESLRVEAEQGRVDAEALRVQAEQGRVDTEALRVQAEQSRVDAESLRVTEEQGRVDAEALRVQAEQGRVNAEALRVSAEQGRVTAESERVALTARDHSRANDDHTLAVSDHQNAASDHSQAGLDHQTASSDHTLAVEDHQTATNDHTRAVTDHDNAAADHQTASDDHTQAGSDHTASVTATGNANDAAALANQKANLAAEKAALADQKATEAANVNATLNGTEITVTDRNGNSVTQDIKGEPGSDADVTTENIVNALGYTPADKAVSDNTVERVSALEVTQSQLDTYFPPSV